ncbi:MAG: NFACT family protein [Nitrospinae bacterium]|nr:NFACT family protein [Nitrospinota bacterium]
MNISAEELGAIVAELKTVLPGARLKKMTKPSSLEWLLRFRKGAEEYSLLISMSPENCRAHLAFHEYAGFAPPCHLVSTLKKLAEGARVESVEQINGDRLFSVAFGYGAETVSLVAELMGPRGIVYLLDGTGKVIAMGPNRKSRLMPGVPYAPPPPREGVSPPVEQDASVSPGLTANRAMDGKYYEPSELERLAEAKKALTAPLKAELKKLSKSRVEIARARQELARYAGHKKLGDTLQASYHQLKKGEREVTVPDIYTGEGGDITIPLDPALAPAANVQRYYKLYRKYEKGLPRTDEELAAVEAREKKVSEKLELIMSAATPAEIFNHFPPPGEPHAKQAQATAKKQPAGAKYRRFIASDGSEILVGRTDRENDEITFKVANGRDLWLHARDYPGSHVVARVQKGSELSRATLIEAAMLAVHFSKASASGKGEVVWSHVKDLSRPKNAPPGKVFVRGGGNTVQVKVDEAVIKRMKQKAAGDSVA